MTPDRYGRRHFLENIITRGVLVDGSPSGFEPCPYKLVQYGESSITSPANHEGCRRSLEFDTRGYFDNDHDDVMAFQRKYGNPQKLSGRNAYQMERHNSANSALQ
jgi:hypothetical protein